jgi:hypothetical protein
MEAKRFASAIPPLRSMAHIVTYTSTGLGNKKMKRRIVHTLQKYLLSTQSPIKLDASRIRTTATNQDFLVEATRARRIAETGS